MKRLIRGLVTLAALSLFATQSWADVCYYRWVYCYDCPFGACLQSGWNSVPYYAEGGTTAIISCRSTFSNCPSDASCIQVGVTVQSICNGEEFFASGTLCCTNW